MRSPSGVQTGLSLDAESRGKRVSTSRPHSYVHRFLVPSEKISNASLNPSGENLMLFQSDGVALNRVVFPSGASQVTALSVLARGMYANTPVLETVICAEPHWVSPLTSSTTGAGCPVSSRRPGSNG